MKDFQEHSKDPHPLQTLPSLANCSRIVFGKSSSRSGRIRLVKEPRYLCEVGRLDGSLELLEIAYQTVSDKGSAPLL